MHPILFQFGNVTIHSYGFMLAVAILVCYFLLRYTINQEICPPNSLDVIFAIALICGFAGAKTLYIIEHLPLLDSRYIIYLLANSGFTWFGGLITGAIGVLCYLRKEKLLFLSFIDILLPVVLLGYAIGRIGCHLAGDGDYGPVSTLPWAVAYPDGILPTVETVHPTPIYESIICLIAFSILWFYRKRVKSSGIISGATCIIIGIERFSMEFVRRTPVIAFGWLKSAQIISIGWIILGVVLIFFRNHFNSTHQFTGAGKND